MRIPALLLALPLAHLAAACTAPAETTHEVLPARTVHGVAPRYLALFEALAQATEAREDETARQIAENLRRRITADGWAQSAARAPGSTREALALLEGFERILRGRELVGSLELELTLRPVPGQPAVEVVLRARTERRTHLELRPGAASLRIHRVTLTVRDMGNEGRSVRTVGVGNLQQLVLDADGWLEVPLGSYATLIPGNALAARTRWSLTLRSGQILEEGESFPAAEVTVTPVERVDLAPYLPNTAVEPQELAAYAQRPEVALAPILERTVRIPPERREEALDLLTPLVERSTAQEIERLVPSLRWLARTATPGRDPLAWREWLRQRARRRWEARGR